MSEFRDMNLSEQAGWWSLAVAHEREDHAVLCALAYNDSDTVTRIINVGSHLVTVRIDGVDDVYRIVYNGRNIIVVDIP